MSAMCMAEIPFQGFHSNSIVANLAKMPYSKYYSDAVIV